MKKGWGLGEVLERENDGKLSGRSKREEQAMKNSMRWGFSLVEIAILFLFFYYFFFPSWLLYSSFGWRVHYFGPRMWSAFPFFGMAILIVAGILIAKYFFQALRDSSISEKDELSFYPYCG